MNIYLLRHGETEENKNRFYYGKLDVSLNDKGKTQALKAREFLEEVNFNKVYTSERLRTKETASLVARKGLNKFVADKRINEMDFGEFEGKDYKEIQKLYPKEYESWSRDWKEFSPPGGESYLEVYNRVKEFMEELLREQSENVLVVTHGGIIRTILCYVLGGNLENFWKFSSKNCDISLIKYEYGNIFIDSITHMK
ncbi:alpha-ribazole phosphatase [Candidatus Clostridium radicumherbarum]|uniref:Alpha-ribazole phosphatase n=1 Tax=Candidatus Clostridium radicumherbarum TaxID=3381662 RepID=A0ABW8TT66_9CLOT